MFAFVARSRLIACAGEEPLSAWGERKEGEESLKRIKTCVDAKEIFFCRPSLHCERHANSFTRKPLRNAGPSRRRRTTPRLAPRELHSIPSAADEKEGGMPWRPTS